MADKRLVIAIFDNEPAAEEAATTLNDTCAIVDDAIAIMSLDADGKLKTHKIGSTSGGKGAAAGVLFGLLGPVGLGVGAAGGALLGKFHHKGIGLDNADQERLLTALRGGKAAVGVLADPDELVAAESILIGRGGVTESHEFDNAVLRESAESAG